MTRPALRLLLVLGPALPLWSYAPGAIADEPEPDGPPAQTPPPSNAPGIGPMTIEPGPTAQPAPPKPVVVPANPQPSLNPVRPGLPPPAAADLGFASVPGLLREGSYVTNAVGQMVRGQSGRWYVVFDPPPTFGSRPLPPMILAENSNLAAMERTIDRLEPGTRLRIAGRVTVYRDRNYLLPSMPPMIERAAPVASSETTDATSAPSEQPGPQTAEPSIADIVAELDRAVGPSRPRPNAPTADAPSAPDMAATGESSADKRVALAGFLTNRRARVIRGVDGRLAARFDAGPDGAPEAPMVLLPCQNLAAIESILDSQGDSALFTMSGEVVVYKGRNYLLPTMYMVNRTTDLVMPTQ